ncbi:MAG TPA: LuxR C-terminal-related transcriptional regulator [Rubrobacter sp.]|nr:LuxR C-terminal-related transcriptional regulator [Rubrobacter sp.]
MILRPKLRAPVPRPEQLVRDGLLALLHDALECRVSVISGPTGYGKTTLLAHWLQAEDGELPFAWVSLDEHDNDPARLWGHIVEALRGAMPKEEDFGADVLVGLGAVGEAFVGSTLSMLINALAESPHQIVLLLDDYQFVTEWETHESIAFFIEHIPENVHLVISSRSDPPLPLGRLRAMGELNEIRTGQLAFTEEEAECLLNEKMGLGIDADDVAILLERTEGWPAGLYLASLSLRNKEDKHAFIQSFRGSDRYIVGLLGEEVLAHLSAEVRQFLLETSVLRRLTGPLCDAVTGRQDSANVLRELARSNLFVVGLDDQDQWYRYHHLFCELLLYELKSVQPGMEPDLRARASEWLEDAGMIEEAVWQAFEAENHGLAGLLIARHWRGYLFAGQTATVQRWLSSLPQDVLAHSAPLTLVKAWICALDGQREESQRFLRLAESFGYEGPLPDGIASVESGVALLEATFGYGGIRHGVQTARLAAELEPIETSPWAVVACLALGSSLYLQGDLPEARRALENALSLADDNQRLVRVVALSFLSFVATDEGHLEEAESLALAAQALVERSRPYRIPQTTLAPIAYGRVLAEKGNLEEAQEELEGALSSRGRLPGLSPWPNLIGLLALAPVLAGRGDRDGARAALAEVRAILDAHPDAGMLPELLERQNRKLRVRRAREGRLDAELTERELEVIGLLDGRLTTRQMAESLFVAPSTVRTQIKSIYRKLGVSSRGEAVAVAREQGLV